MLSRPATLLGILVLVIAGAAIYTPRLGEVPAYLMHDETQGALQAQSISTTGRDLTGRRLPLYFTEPEFPPGRDPLMIYFTALVLKIAPFTEAGVRLSSAVIAIVDVVLMFLLAQRLFGSTAMGMVAAGLLLLTPIHFIRGRLLLSPLFTVPFILGWLWAFLRFTEAPTPRRLVICATILGFGMYSYLAAVVMMPVYLLVTMKTGLRLLGMKAVVQAAVAFAATLLPMAAWYVTHPERNAEIVSQYQLGAAASSPLGRWVALYWSFFDPSFLFVSGDSSLINSTREAGFFPTAFVVLMPIGLYGLMRSRQPVAIAIVVGLLTAPLVSIISGAIEMNRIMFAIPFGVLAAAYGAHVLVRSRMMAAKAIGVLLLLSVVGQFAGFYAGYMNSYRTSSASWFAGSAREAIRAAMDRAATTSPVYVSSEIEWVHRTWRFYAIADGKPDMISRAVYVNEAPAAAPSGSLLLVPLPSRMTHDGWEQVQTVTSIDGRREFSILRRGGD